MIEEIKLNNTTSIYKTKINVSDIDQLISDINLNLDVSKDTKKPLQHAPGIQSTVVISTSLIKELTEKIINVLFETFDIPNSNPYVNNQWIYISNNKNIYSGFHTHDEQNKKRPLNISLKWTYTYYVQMPNNLVGDDGKLLFKLDDDSEHMILPEVADLLIFPTTLLHAPMTNSQSDIDRIVFAGIFSDINIITPIKKNNKTLL
jgi:hypothetical protein